MKERPILFSSEMVKAILEGRKTMTRRVNSIGEYYIRDKKCPYGVAGDRLWVRETWGDLDYYQGNVAIHVLKDSNGVEHDIVYSAECQGYFEWTDEVGFPEYRKDGTEASRWRPSIFMPRWASRILLEVTDVKVERLQDITEEDAIKEGMPDEYPIAPVYCPNCQGQGTCGAVHPVSLGYMEIDCPECDTAKKKFKNLWDSINGRGRKPGRAWQDNPWVWVISFKVVEA